MTIANQLSALPISGGDVTFKNYGVTAIASGLGVLADGTNKGDANNPPGIVLPTASGGVAKTLGITTEIIPAGGTGKVRMLGGAVGLSFATLTPGDLVEISDTTAHMGEIIAATSTHRTVGTCLTDCIAGDPVLVWVNQTGHN